MNEKQEKFDIQNYQYSIPYHHLVNFQNFSNVWIMPWGEEYYVYIQKALDLLKKYSPESVLDVGCGDGKVNFELAKLYGNQIKNVGVDLSERAILLAKGLNYGNNVEFFCKPISDLKGQFDAVLLIEVLEHIPNENINEFVLDIKSKIKKGGILIISVPSKQIPIIDKHYRHYDEELLNKQLNGLKLIKIFYLIKNNFLGVVLNKLIRRFASISFLRKALFKFYFKFCANGNKKSYKHILALYKNSN
ncbi:MAG: methyltransferase domain-containing protein [Candidatus Zambryskibacteria bacterium]|nr:methyltransferase domain-containing protein [Candidatus Zambryskibacteria bacterium]